MRVLLVPNVSNPRAVTAAVEIATWLTAQDAVPVLEMSDAAACDLLDCGLEAFEIGEPDLVVTFGGDGTILKAVHTIGEVEVPILGVNFGRLGFMTAVGPSSIRQAISTVLAGEARIERRATLRVRAQTASGELEWRALNEVAVVRTDTSRVVGVGLSIDGVEISRFRADGIIVATATGSTAYALSAGGPFVAPGFGGAVVVPVAPHTLASRALCTDPGSVVEIEIDPTRGNACVHVDGATVPCPSPVASLAVTRDATDVLLARIDGRGFYDAVAGEFFGG